MDNIQTTDSRDTTRRNIERRIVSRRIIRHPFGSQKWLQAVQADYLLWPKEDRRIQDRRCINRRQAERRTGLQKQRRWSARQQPLLTPEEISMLRALSRRL